MGKIWDAVTGRNLPPVPDPKRMSFSALPYTPIGSDEATREVFGLIAGGFGSMVSREELWSVPGFIAARDKFCDLSTLPLHCTNNDGLRISRKLLDQPENTLGYDRSYTLAWTIEDLLADGVSLWVVTDRDSTQYPTAVRRVPFGKWSQDDTGTVRVGPDVVPAGDVILFLSSRHAWRKSGAGIVKDSRLLAAAARKYSQHTDMIGHFKPGDGQAPGDDEIQAFLSQFAVARELSLYGFVPEGVDYVPAEKRLTSEEIQLATAREFVISELSRVTGVSPYNLGLATTSHVYSNIQDERKDWLDGPASSVIRVIEQRLSRGDVTPYGQQVKFNFDAYLRQSITERYAAYSQAVAGRWMTVDEIRALEDLPELPTQDDSSKPIESDTDAGEGHNSIEETP